MANAPKGRLLDTERRIMAAVESARVAAGMSQVRLAELVGVSQPQVSRMLSGDRPVTIPELFMMCDALGLDPAVVIASAG